MKSFTLLFQVSAKRTNRPGISTTNRGRGRGRGFRGGMGGGFYQPYNAFSNFPRGRGRAMFRYSLLVL